MLPGRWLSPFVSLWPPAGGPPGSGPPSRYYRPNDRSAVMAAPSAAARRPRQIRSASFGPSSPPAPLVGDLVSGHPMSFGERIHLDPGVVENVLDVRAEQLALPVSYAAPP
jgi:hypothetical protein